MKKEILKPITAVKQAKALVVDDYKEHFIGIYLNARNIPTKIELISMGTLNASIVHPREVFSPAIVNHASQVIVLHNHPSENVKPSVDDIEITERLVKAGKILGIELIDHIIFTKGKKFYSFKENNLIN